MAKVLYTAIVAEMRNKLAGSVFTRNRYGNIVRNKVTPTNPNTAAQMGVRTKFATAAQAWRDLTEDQRSTWLLKNIDFPSTDVFGRSNVLSGFNLFQKVNFNLALIGESQMDNCPAPSTFEILTGLSIVADTSLQTVKMFLQPAVVPTGFKLIICLTNNLSPGIYFANKYFRIVATVDAATTVNNRSIPTNFGTLRETLVTGQKVFLKAYLISKSSGQSGVPVSASTITIA